MKTSFGLFTFLVVCAVVTSTPDYYWRPFDGTKPPDAFVATDNGDGDESYIGNAPVFDGGLYVGQLFPGKREITVTGEPTEGGLFHPTKVHKRTELIHILCTGSPEMFEWHETTSTEVMTIPYHKVEGGFQGRDDSLIHIGRIKYLSTYIIGKVTDYGDSGSLWYFDGEKEVEALEFEVLVYTEVDRRVKAP